MSLSVAGSGEELAFQTGQLVGFLIVLLIGYIIARVVKGVVTKLLQKVGLDRALHSGSTGQYVNKAAPDLKPSSLIGSLAFWFLFLGAVAIAVSQLGIAALDNFVAAIGAYIPNIIAAVLIFVIAGVVAAAVGGLVARTMGDTPTGKVVGSVVPVLVMDAPKGSVTSDAIGGSVDAGDLLFVMP